MAPTRAKRSHLAPIVLALLGIALLGAAGYGLYGSQADRQSNGSLTLYGNIDLREVQLAFNDAGRIAQMYVQAGDHVQRGQLLATLDTRRFNADLQRAAAQTAAAKAALDTLLAGTRPEDIARLRALVAADTAQLRIATLTYRRLDRLAAQHVTSPQSRDEARATMQAAAGKLDADRAALALAVAGPRKQDIAQARAQLDAAQAAQALAQQTLNDAALHAPSAGVIRDRILEPGDMASPAAPVYSLALTNPLWARVYVDEADLGRIKLGLPATVSSDSFPGERFKGWVGYLSPSAEFTPKSVQTTRVRTELVYQARVYVCDAHNRLRLGMPVTVHIDTTAAPVQRGASPCAAHAAQ
ncbi:efflux RND transporter periplasmic adaptor subunit [Acidihalobacter ferrooxydans]|uniref:Hemolysin D n=1 Tax=Acidihalobacter ferrooxydans TaxID=1765967 RepID=A0A1P8UIU5_9GAMM|nr:efflux RND transporter periplasmic adaptor subunit [Acidihalobacter ferrooxydans]APZ43691.1 hypothetical protein BW247_11815 [Acidihalobacter ferrooxydans]